MGKGGSWDRTTKRLQALSEKSSRVRAKNRRRRAAREAAKKRGPPPAKLLEVRPDSRDDRAAVQITFGEIAREFFGADLGAILREKE